MRPGGPSLLGADPTQLGDAHFDYRVLARVLRFAKPYRWMLGGFGLVLFVQALLDLVPPFVFRSIIDDALPDAGQSGDRGLLALLAGIAVLGAIGSAVAAFTERWLSSRIGEGVIYDLRVAVFDHVQRLPLAFFTRTQTGALTSRLNNDVIGAQRALTNTLGSVVSNSIILTTTLAAMLRLEWRSTVFALVVLPVFILPAKRVGRRLRAITREQMNLNASMNSTMTERFNVSGALLVKLFGRSGEERESFAQRADGVRATGVKAAVYGRTFFLALGFVGALATATVYWIGGSRVIDGSISKGTLVALAALVPRLYGPLTALTNARVDLMSAIVSFERVFEVLDAPNPIPDKEGASELRDVRGSVRFDDVWFRYPTDATVPTLELDPNVAAPANGSVVPADSGFVLRGIDVAIEPGQLVALVGPSGAGKTTLANLVPRLYDVTEGAVRIDGVDVREVSQRSLRNAIGVVSQDPHLFHEPILANLRYARPGATEEEIEQACRAAQIHDVIAKLPDGFATVVGERGYRLSGGEKQRLAIARMFLKDPAVVILDEATSHLDSENEALVQRALSDAMAGRTSLVIAHRLSTITSADLILVMDKGRIVERGTHSELLGAGGLYSELYRTLLGQHVA